MGGPLIRIVSDVHYADRGSRVKAFSQLGPLAEGASSLVFNGDTLDTRPSDDDARTGELKREVLGFFAKSGPPTTFMTGNHDPDISSEHFLDAAGGRVFATHGDILFDTVVPWSSESGHIRGKIEAALAAVPNGGASSLEGRLSAFRAVAAGLPQRHQSVRNPLKYLYMLAGDTVWPPNRAFSILKAWSQSPEMAASLAARHRPAAKVVLIGHVHRPGVFRTKSGVVVVNTGSFCRPFGAFAADVTDDCVRVRRVEQAAGGFRAGALVEEIGLS